MLEYIVIIGLIVGAGFFVIHPLLQSGRTGGSLRARADNMLTELNQKKENAYAAIRELEFDLNMGKLSKEDFETLRGQYMQDALECIKTMDELQIQRKRQAGLPEKDLENEIEREISSLRADASVGAAEIFCTKCGQGASCQDRFCAKCGAQLTKS